MSRLVEAQASWLDVLRGMLPAATMGVDQDLFLARNGPDGKSPGPWTHSDFWDPDKRADFRNVLWNELMFDFDHPSWIHNVVAAVRLQHALLRRSIPHYTFPTGGKGLHTSVFLDASGYQRLVDWQDIRMAVYNRLCIEAAISTDTSRVAWSDTTMGALVRMEGGLRWRVADLLTFQDRDEHGKVPSYKFWVRTIPLDQPIVTRGWEVNFPGAVRCWKVPTAWLPEPEPQQRRTPGNTLALRGGLPDVIRVLIAFMQGGGDLNDYGRFAVAAHMLSRGYDVNAVVDLYRPCPDFSERITREKVERMAKSGKIRPPGNDAIMARCSAVIQQMGKRVSVLPDMPMVITQ